MKRRDLLAAGSSLSLTALAGCSEGNTNSDQPSSDQSDSSSGESSNEGSSTKDLSTPSQVEETTLPAEHTIAEWRGTFESGEDQYHLNTEIPPSDAEVNSLRDGECFVLECEISAPDTMPEEETMELYLIPFNDYEGEFEEDAQPKSCVQIHNFESCYNNFEAYDRDNVLGEPVKIKPGDNKYVRYLLADDSYYLIIDGADTLGGRFFDVSVNRDFSEVELDTQIRVLEYSSMEARQAAREAFDQWLNQVASESSEETVDDAESFAQDICGLEHEAPSNESAEELAQDADQLEDYIPFINGLIDAANKRYGLGLPRRFADRLQKMARWGSTALPVIGSIITVAEKACTLANGGLSDEKRQEVSAGLLLSLAGLVVEIVLIEWGIASRVAKGAIELTEQFVFGYIRKIGGLRLFGYLFKNLKLELEDGIFAAIAETVDSFLEEIADMFLSSTDLKLLAGLSDSASSWEDLATLEEADCSCDSLGHSGVCSIDVVG